MITIIRHSFHYYSKAWNYYALSIVLALIASGIGGLLIHYESALLYTEIFQRILLTCGVAFPLFALSWWMRQHKSWNNSYLLLLFALLASSGFYGYLNYWDIFNTDAVVFTRHWLVIVLSILIAWLSPLLVSSYISFSKKNTLWELWKVLIANTIIAGLSWLILWGGLSASLASISYLFDVTVNYKWYAYLGIGSFGLIAVGILFSRLATSTDEDYSNYPQLFQFFGLYVFWSLALIYALILLFYGIKILLSGIWPKGLVAWMVIWYTILWWISYLLILPLRKDNTIVQYATQGYLVSLIVFALLLLWALWVRVNQYGITPMRYLLGMVVIWMILSGWRGIWKTNHSLSGMIVLLLLLLASSAYTPRSANAISQLHQTQHLKSLILASGLWDIQDFAEQHYHIDELSDEQITQIRLLARELRYFHGYYGTEASARIISTDRDMLDQTDYRKQMEIIYSHVFGLDWDLESLDIYSPEESDYFTIWSDSSNTHIEQISEFNYMVDILSHTPIHYISEDENLSLKSDSLGNITIINNDQIISFNPQDFAEQIYTLSTQRPWITRIDTDEYSIIISSASWEKKDNNITLDYYEFKLLIQ